MHRSEIERVCVSVCCMVVGVSSWSGGGGVAAVCKAVADRASLATDIVTRGHWSHIKYMHNIIHIHKYIVLLYLADKLKYFK